MDPIPRDDGTVELKERYGGHGGLPTRWEIRTTTEWQLEVIKALPDLWPIQHWSGEYTAGIDLPEDVGVMEAGIVVAMLTNSSEAPDLALQRYLESLQVHLKSDEEYKQAEELRSAELMESMSKILEAKSPQDMHDIAMEAMDKVLYPEKDK